MSAQPQPDTRPTPSKPYTESEPALPTVWVIVPILAILCVSIAAGYIISLLLRGCM